MPPNASEWPAARVRKTFFDFFAERGHTVGESKMPRQPQTVILSSTRINLPMASSVFTVLCY
jgi:alanyl-tRNA synthetase